MNPLDLIGEYYRPGSLVYEVLVRHSELVAESSVEIAGRIPELMPNVAFIGEAAMFHDIGILFTNSPEIGCFGRHAYVCHGYLGRSLLEKHGLPEHALVCERHVGAGLSADDIAGQGLDLPLRDMLPETIEEQIICFADSFFSKTPPPRGTQRTPEEIIASLELRGKEKADRFRSWLDKFGSVA